MTKDEIIAKLEEKGIDHDPNALKADLEALLPKEEAPEAEDIEIGDPQVLRPKELPLVVKLPKDASPAQEEYAKILNSYAYQNPEKWESKKDELVAKLKALKGKDLVMNENRNLEVKQGEHKNGLSFSFTRDADGNPMYLGSSLPATNVETE